MDDYVEMTDKFGAKFHVYAPAGLLKELKERENASSDFDYLKVNWGSYRTNDRFFDDESNPYSVDVCGNVVELCPM